MPLAVCQKLWFQYEEAPKHNGKYVRKWIDATWPGRWIGRGGLAMFLELSLSAHCTFLLVTCCEVEIVPFFPPAGSACDEFVLCDQHKKHFYGVPTRTVEDHVARHSGKVLRL